MSNLQYCPLRCFISDCTLEVILEKQPLLPKNEMPFYNHEAFDTVNILCQN